MESTSSWEAANLSPESAKLFVGGINESLSEEVVRVYFTKFGEVKEVAVVKDRVTDKVRGFGFVEFLDPCSAESALNEVEHTIGDRRVEVKRARPRREQPQTFQSPQYQYPYPFHRNYYNRAISNNVANNYSNGKNSTRSKKIFVGGLPSSIRDDDFRSYFEMFGNITDVVIMYDSATHRPRGFGFITYDSAEAVDYVLQSDFHVLNNKKVEVKVAVPKGSNNQNSFNIPDGIQNGFYPTQSPRYGSYMFCPPPPVPAFYYGTVGYGLVPNGGLGYGFVSSRSPLPAGNASMFYFNPGFGRYGGMSWGGYYNNLNGNSNLNGLGSDVQIMEIKETEDAGSQLVDSPQAS